MISTVVKPVYELEKAREKVIIQQKVSASPFLFDEISKELPTEFEIYFRQGKSEYRYNLSICADEVIEESSLPKTMYVIYTSKSGPTKWTHSKEAAIDYVSKNKSSKYKAVKAL